MGIDALPRALHCARNGEAVITRRLTMRLIEDLRLVRQDSAGMRPIQSKLTSREWEVLDLLCQDLFDRRDRRPARRVRGDRPLRTSRTPNGESLEVRSRREAVAAASRLRAHAAADGLSPSHD